MLCGGLVACRIFELIDFRVQNQLLSLGKRFGIFTCVRASVAPAEGSFASEETRRWLSHFEAREFSLSCRPFQPPSNAFPLS